MNFLALSRRACVEAGVASGTAITTALPTVVGATGSVGRVVAWVNDAWGDVQMDFPDWDWMRSSSLLGAGVSFQTIAGQASYPLGTGAGTVGVGVDAFGKWDLGTFRCFPTAVGFQGEIALDDIGFEEWRDSYMLGALRSVQTRPIVVAIGPDQSLCLGPPPNGQYTIEADYFVAPSELVVDNDVPLGLPTRFHPLLIYRCMIKAGQYEAASELVQRGEQESASMYAQLIAARAPRIGFAGALA